MKKRGKKGQSANEAVLIIMLLTFFLIVTMAAVSDDIITASNNNYKTLLLDVADVIEQEANIAFSSENGYFHSFTLPQTLNGMPYIIGIINSSSIGDQANITILFVASANKNIPLNITKVLARDILGSLQVGQVSVRKEKGVVILRPLGALYTPTIISINPPSGSTGGGTSVTISGSNFVSGATVTFGGAAVTVNSVFSNQITVTTPAHAAGVVDVVVTNPDGQSGTLVGGFTYVPPPSVSSVSPNIGPYTGGTAVTINGADFVSGATVTFGGVPATVNSVTGSVITVVAPSYPASRFVGVTVVNPDGQSATAPSQFLYRISPTLVGTVFVTSSASSGYTIGGLKGADKICNDLAKAGNFEGNNGWTAWLSNSAGSPVVNAKDRITDTTYSGLDNMLIAASKADLTDGFIAHTISVANDGTDLSAYSYNVWTGTNSGGTSSGYDCIGWTSTSPPGTGTEGITSNTDGSWTNDGTPYTCWLSGRLYCFRTS